MNKSVLVVTQSYSMGGLETYINTQVQDLAASGYRVHLLSGSIADPSVLPEGLCSYQECSPFSIGSISQLVRHIDLIRKIIKEKNIDIIHIHPFDCIFPSVIAADCEKIPALLTLHGPLSLQHFTRNIYNQTLAIYFLSKLHTIFCVSRETAYQLGEIIDHPSVLIVPNLIDDNQISVAALKDDNNRNWLIASRLDNDKSAGIINFINFASQCDFIHNVDIYGSGNNESVIKEYVNEHGFDNWVRFKGTVNSILTVMGGYGGFAGMGRGVLEAAFNHLPICLVGYDGIKGILDEKLFEQASFCNFSGRNLNNVSVNELIKQFSTAHPLPLPLLAQYKSAGRWSQLLENIAIVDKQNYKNFDSIKLYQLLVKAQEIQQGDESYLQAESFTTAIFKILTDRLIEHRTTISTQNELEREDFRMENTPNNELDAILSHLKDLKSSEQSIVDKLSTLEQQNLHLQQDIQSIVELLGKNSEKESNSMSFQLQDTKISHIQKLKFLSKLTVISVLDSSKRYELIKSIYWKLPEKLRTKLQFWRYRYVQKHFQSRYDTAMTEATASVHIPAWISEINQAEKVMFIPCSFEFDELVNQRPINAAKYFAENGYKVIFIAWQWTPQDKLLKGCSQVWQNVHQVPLYDFINSMKQCHLAKKTAIFIVTFPAQIFIPTIQNFRKEGCYIAYDIMDEWECFNQVGQAPWYQLEVEKSIILQSDYVCAVAPSLRDKFSSLRKDIDIVGNGYSIQTLGNTHNIAQKNLSKVGYFGHLTDSWFDWDIVFKLANHYTQYHFEIIGYGEPEWVIEKVKSFDNITIVGKVLPKNLHQYVRYWSMGLIPFKSGKLAQAVDPIKIYEYLYFGLPTLTTGIEHIKNYPMTYYSDGSDIIATFGKVIHAEHNTTKLDIFLEDTTWSARFKKVESNILSKNGLRNFYAS